MPSSRDAGAVEASGPVADREPVAEAQGRSVVVEDGVASGPHQLTRTAFLERLDEVVRSSVEGVLRPSGWSARECPYVGRYLERLRDEPLTGLETAVGLWIRPAHDTADDWFEAIAERTREAAVAWRDGRSDPLLRRVVPSADADLVGSARGADPRAVMTRLGEGDPLPTSVRSRAESAFGVDFSRVRMHVDAVAQRIASENRARAFTLGDHVGFAAGQFRPGTLVGDAVLSHELAHTLQQAGSTSVGHGTDTLEHEADHAALAAGRGAPRPIAGGRGLALQRCGGGDKDAVPADASLPPAAGVGEQVPEPVTGAGDKAPATTPARQSGSKPTVIAPTLPTTPASGGSATADFGRGTAPGTITEPPAAATPPGPLPAEPVPADPLAVTDDPLPLDSIKDAEPFWGHKDAESLAIQIAAAYVARKAKRPRDLAELQTDFNDVVRASFTRSGWGAPWPSLRPALQKGLADARSRFIKQHPKATPEEIAAFLHQTKQEQRERVRQWVATAAWAWMVERRDRLDFETIGAPGGREVARLPADAHLDDAAKDRVRRGAVAAVATYAAGLQQELEKQRAAAEAADAGVRGPDAAKPDPKKPDPKKKPSPLDKALEAVAAVLESTRAIESLIAERDTLQQGLDALSTTPLGEVPLVVDDPKAKAARQALTRRIGAVDETFRRRLPKLLGDVDALRATHKLRGIGPVRVGDLVFNPAGAFTWTSVDTPIHHRLAEILDAIGTDYGTFGAGSYGGVAGGHASGDFTSSFRSVDLYPSGVPAGGGYFDRDKALAFALAIDRVAAAQGYTYRILYDDYVVAREFNKQAKFGRMSNQDNVEYEKDAKQQPQLDKPRNLNWHGPLVTHFHVDFSY